MKSEELTPFLDVPFLFWFKDTGGTYKWGNHEIERLAGCQIAGRMDAELPWAANAQELREHDQQALDNGKAQFLHEYVDHSSEGTVTLSVCKWPGDLDGTQGTFGISFRVGGA